MNNIGPCAPGSILLHKPTGHALRLLNKRVSRYDWVHLDLMNLNTGEVSAVSIPPVENLETLEPWPEGTPVPEEQRAYPRDFVSLMAHFYSIGMENEVFQDDQDMSDDVRASHERLVAAGLLETHGSEYDTEYRLTGWGRLFALSIQQHFDSHVRTIKYQP